VLDAPKQFIQTQPVASVDRGSEWIGGECDGFLCGAEGSSYIGVNEDGDDVFVTTFWRSLWGDLFAIVRGRAKGQRSFPPSEQVLVMASMDDAAPIKRRTSLRMSGCHDASIVR